MAYGNNNYYGANNYSTPFTPYTQNQSYAQPNYYNNAMGMNNNSYVQQPIMNNGTNQNQQQSNQQIYLPLTFVRDINEAKRFIVNPNQTIYMRDSNSKDIMYIKSMDSQGTINFQVKKLVDVDMNNNNNNQNSQMNNQQNNSIDLRDYVKRDELKELKDKINDLNNALMSFNKPLNNGNTNNNTREKRG